MTTPEPATADTDITPPATTQPDALWIERVGTRRYTAHNGRGAQVEIGSIEHDGRFTPGELLKVALAGCTGLTSDASFARRLGDGYRAAIHVSGAKDVDEDRYPELAERLELDLSGLDEDARARLLTVVNRAIEQTCTVGRTITRGTEVTLQIVDTATGVVIEDAAERSPAT